MCLPFPSLLYWLQDGGKDFFDVLQEVMVIDLTEMATVLVKVYLGCDEITSFLDCLCQEDIKACGMDSVETTLLINYFLLT